MRLLIVTLIFGFWGLFSVWTPAVAAGLLLWVDICAPLELAYSTGALPLSSMALAAILLSYIVNIARGRFRPKPTWFVWMWCVFMAWALICMLISEYPQVAQTGYVTMLKYLGPLLLVSMSARNLDDVRFLCYALAISLGIWGAQIGLGCLMHGMNNYMHIEGTQMGDNNFLSAGVVAILPILLVAATDYSGRFKWPVRAGWGLALVLCLSTVVFSNSRGAALGVVGNVCIYLAFISKKKIRDVAVVIAVGSVVVMLLPDSFWNRMNTLQDVGTERAEGSARERLLLVQSTFRATQEHPIFGVGPYVWTTVSNSYTGLTTSMQPHNIWLKCAVELGYPGLLIFITLIFGTIFRLVRARNQALKLGQIRAAKLALALASCQIGYFISLTFLSNYDLEFQWAWLAIGNAFVAAWNRNLAGLRKKKSRPVAAEHETENDPASDEGRSPDAPPLIAEGAGG